MPPVMALSSALPVPLKAAGSGEDQILDVGAEGIGCNGRSHRVGAGAGVFRDHVTDIVDDVGVVAGAADQRVGAGSAIESVIAGSAFDGVAQRIAGPRKGTVADERKVLDIGGKV